MKEKGFTLIELLVVIAIISILLTIVIVALTAVRRDAFDARIKNDIRQLRILAESAYDSAAASYLNWSTKPVVQAEVVVLLEEIDAAHNNGPGAPYVAVIADSQAKEFCISAPLHISTGSHYCIDDSGVFKTTATSCPTTAPLACP